MNLKHYINNLKHKRQVVNYHLKPLNILIVEFNHTSQSVLTTSLIHHYEAAWYKVSRRGPKHNSERGGRASNRRKLQENREKSMSKGKNQPFAIDVKGGGRASNSRKSRQIEKMYYYKENILPSMPKGENVGNVVIDGKGAQRSNT